MLTACRKTKMGIQVKMLVLFSGPRFVHRGSSQRDGSSTVTCRLLLLSDKTGQRPNIS
jgi:hypothetical protein